MAPEALAHLQGVLVEAQSRRIRELEQHLGERVRVLRNAADALVAEIRRREEVQAALIEAQKMETLGHIAGGMAHDLRNVLGVMSLGCEILKLKTDEPDLLKVAENGERALQQARGLIDGLLDFMRPREDEPEILEPAAWLARMGDLLGYAAGRNLSCRLVTAPDVWPVRVVEHRLGAALLNLTVNARDAMPEGGEVLVAVRNLTAGAPRPPSVPEGSFVVFSVADTGCGMTPEVLARATEPLFSTKPPGQGTGLGLAMVRDFALACAGYLHIASETGAGTRVELYLPRGEPAAPPPKPFGNERSALLDALGGQPPPGQEQAAILDRLIVRLRSPDLLAALLGWRAARGMAFLPTLDALVGIAPFLADRMFVAEREGTLDEPGFRFLSVGSALTGQLGRSLEGESVGAAEEQTVGSLGAAYRRAARAGLPSYEHARYALDDGPPVRFERLILPASRDGEQVSHLVGFVLILNFPEPSPGVLAS